MKKHILYMALLATTAFATACNDTGESLPPALGLEYSDEKIPALGGVFNLTIDSPEPWTVEKHDNIDWITITPSSGEGTGTVSVTVGFSPSTQTRSTSLLIRTPGKAKTVTIVQEKLSLPAQGGIIDGPSKIIHPQATGTLISGPIKDATGFQWFLNGVAIDGATDSTLEISQSGSYTVAGTNILGTGMPSPPKTVTIIRDLLMSDLEGTWSVTETSNPMRDYYPGLSSYSVTIEATGNPGEFRINGLGAVDTDEVAAPRGIIATATLTGEFAGTLSIRMQTFEPTWYPGEIMWLCAMVNYAPADLANSTITKEGNIVTINLASYSIVGMGDWGPYPYTTRSNTVLTKAL